MSNYFFNRWKSRASQAYAWIDDDLMVSGGIRTESGKFIFNDDTGMLTVDGAIGLTGSALITGDITVNGTVDGRNVGADGIALDTVVANYLDKTSVADNAIAGNVTLADDKALALSASGTAKTTLQTFGTDVAKFKTSSDDFFLTLGSGATASFRIANASDSAILKIDKNGIITGVSAIPTDITTGVVSGLVVDNNGKIHVSEDSITSRSKMLFYNPNGLIASLQTSGLQFAIPIAQVGGSFSIQDSTGSDALAVFEDKSLRFNGYGAGTLVTDASGNVSTSSDSRLKIKTREFNYGGEAVCAISEMMGFHKWNELSGMEQEGEYASFWADEVFTIIPEAAPKNIRYKREEFDTGEVEIVTEAELDEDGNIVKDEVTKPVMDWRDTDEIESDFHSLDFKPIIMALCKAHKDQCDQIADLTTRLAALEA